MQRAEFNTIQICTVWIVLFLLSSCSQEQVKDEYGQLLNEKISILCKTKEGRPYVISGFQNKKSAMIAMKNIWKRYDYEYESNLSGDQCLLLKMDEK